MSAHLTRTDCEGVLRGDVYPMQWMGPMTICCGDSEEDGNVRSECEENEDTGCEDADSDTNW
jgi:hypothetical protein